MKHNKIHLKGIHCNSGKRWKSCILTSVNNPGKVTCEKCLRILNKNNSQTMEYNLRWLNSII